MTTRRYNTARCFLFWKLCCLFYIFTWNLVLFTSYYNLS